VQVLTAEQATGARLAAARARVQAEEVRLAQARIVAPDDGVISARSATVGSLTQPGQELFRLIRGGRLEWRAEVTGTELTKLAPGQRATLTTAGGARIEGTVRAVAPSVDPATRNGIVYVDLPPASQARAGTFARGEFELGRGEALTLPQSAVVLRDGFAYVFLVNADNKVVQNKVEVGRRLGDRIEIVAGLSPAARVVETGAGFLADGDTVRVVDSAASAQSAER
jgi:RND family efflux transporter MFP subunit